MVPHMKITPSIDETEMQQLQEKAVRPDTLPPLPAWNSGGFRVDVANQEELHRLMGED